MDVPTAVQWIAFAVRKSVPEVIELGLTDDQILTLGQWLSGNGLLNPPGQRLVKKRWQKCACGCGEWFEAEWVTGRPMYINNTHKVRAYRARKKERGRG